MSRARRRSQGLVRVDSPYAPDEDVDRSPSLAVRLRGSVGMFALVVLFGVLGALSVAVLLAAMVVAAVTAIN